ncbi:MAG: hypothetical protein AAF682_12580 [Planctomycetota bacterium]
MKPLSKTLSVLAAGALLSAGAEAQNVFDISPDFPGILSATINVAQPGDVILLRPGTYGNAGTPSSPATTILDKPLTLISSSEGPVTLQGYLLVQNIDQGETVVIRGLDFNCKPAPSANLAIPRNLGTFNFDGFLWLEECTFDPGLADAPSSGGQLALTGPGGSLFPQAECVISRCTITGSDALATGSSGGQDGIRAINMSIAMYASTVSGGDGRDQIVGAGDGGEGLKLENSYLHSSGSTISGGKGGDHTGTDIFSQGGDGGDAIDAFSGSDVDLADTVLTPGAGGINVSFPNPGPDGLDVRLSVDSDLRLLDGTATQTIIESPVNDGTGYQLAHIGPPGALLFYIASADPTFFATGAYVYHGELLTEFDFIGPTGVTFVNASLNDYVKAPAEAGFLYVQTMSFVDNGMGGAAFNGLSSPSVMVVIEPSAAVVP